MCPRDPDDELRDDHPGSSGGWSQSGTLTSRNADKQVSCQANFPRSGNYTVELGITLPSAGIKNRKTEALITWKVEGNEVTRRVDVQNGVSVTGVGQACSVVIRDVTPGTGAIGTDYIVSIQVAPGVRGSNKQPPTLSPAVPSRFVLLAGGVAALTIPADAGVISYLASAVPVVAGALVSGDVTVAQNSPGAGTPGFVSDARDQDWIPVVAGTTTLLISNNSAVSVGVSLMFGIDG